MLAMSFDQWALLAGSVGILITEMVGGAKPDSEKSDPSKPRRSQPRSEKEEEQRMAEKLLIAQHMGLGIEW